jgi:hypothetical protein
MTLPYESTTIAPEKSMAEILKLCRQYGADDVGFSSYPGVGFDLVLRFRAGAFPGGESSPLDVLPVRLPFRYAEYLARMKKEHPTWNRDKLVDQAERVCWRMAVHYLKPMLEVVEYGFFPLSRALLAGFEGPDGKTIGETITPLLVEWHQRGLRALPAAVLDADFEEVPR